MLPRALLASTLLLAGAACSDDDDDDDYGMSNVGDGDSGDGDSGDGDTGDGDTGDGDTGDGDTGDGDTGDGDAGDGDAGDGDTADVIDPDTAPQVEVDRFSEDAGHLMVRTDDNGLPEADAPIDYDKPPFITTGLGPDGEVVRYYNFDVQPTTPAPIFVLFREGEDAPVEGQLNIIDDIPGDDDYNDFWLVTKVTVPEDYVANTYGSLSALVDADLDMETTDIIVNCPVVPDGSTATMRMGDGDAGLTRGFYRDQVVTYFEFGEAMLMADGGEVPVSPIYVTFNKNPDEDGGGPPSGFVAEEDDEEQTHNVVATLPDDDDYSPLWLVNIYDNADFDDVMDLDSAMNATELMAGAALVNCPIVDVE